MHLRVVIGDTDVLERLLTGITPHARILNGSNWEPSLIGKDAASVEQNENGPPSQAGRYSNYTLSLTYATFTSMAFGLAFSDFGRWRFSTPSLNSAFTFASSITSGSEKVRTKLPYERSIR
jgi:hypothetical protein